MQNIKDNINKITLAWLNSINGISNGIIDKFIKHFGSLENIWFNFENEKKSIKFINEELKNKLYVSKNKFPDKLFKKLESENIEIITIFDDNYPKKLASITNPPYLLYIKGDITIFENTLIAVIGSRKATTYGKWATEKFTRELANLGVTIVSGFANGLDTIAHQTAIKNNSKTIAVLGSGIDIVYPKKNYNLYLDIILNGAILSEYTFGMSPLASNFPNRNRIISGLCEGVLITEAMDKSGTLITAGHAANQGREVFAIPGNIDSLYSRGTNNLIRDGAKIVTCVDDICEEIPSLRDNVTVTNIINFEELNNCEKQIVKFLFTGGKTIHEIDDKINEKVNEILSTLTLLEMKGYIKQLPGKKFVLAK